MFSFFVKECISQQDKASCKITVLRLFQSLAFRTENGRYKILKMVVSIPKINLLFTFVGVNFDLLLSSPDVLTLPLVDIIISVKCLQVYLTNILFSH